MPDFPRHPCPKCRRSLAPSGVATVDGAELPVYQCDECLVAVDFLGMREEQALTFAVTPDGRAVDPAEPDGEIRF
ncbi:MAG TPA: hypothetical protein VF796_16025 [Humisphaera sp.]